MKIAISAETTVDLTQELIAKYDIKITPFYVTLGDRTAPDGEITPEDIFEYVELNGVLPKTSAINEYTYSEYFKSLLNDYDAVIHFSLSSELSSSYSNAVAASNKLQNVHVINSKSLSTGIALQAIYACKLRDEGKTPSEICKLVRQRRGSVQASFVVNTLNYLYKGGRCSGVTNIIGTLLRIKPQILLTAEGKMVPGKKYMGKGSKVVKAYCSDVLEEFNNIDTSLVFITHSHASPEMIEAAKQALIEKGITNIEITVAGATITSHCGPKTLGILYYNDGGVK